MDNILVVAPSWIGDLVISQSLYRALKEQHPKANIDVIAPKWCQAVISHMPEINSLIDMPIGHGQLAFKKRLEIGKSLRTKNYQQAYVLPNSWKSALIPFWANIPKRTGWLGEFRYGLLNDARKLDKHQYESLVERYVALAHPKNDEQTLNIPIPKLSTTEKQQQQTLKDLTLSKAINPKQKTIVLCPGAQYGPAKRWPPKYFAEVAQQLSQNGWQIILTGGQDEELTAKQIEQRCTHNCINLTGKTTLTQAIDIISLATVVITNDSGLMHIAAAFHKPTIAIYGSSSPVYTPPLNDQAIILYKSLPCSPCFARTCRYSHYHCLTEITPEEVLEKIAKLKL